MTIYERNAGAWHQFQTTPQGSKLLYFRINGAWVPILDVWVANGGTWHKEPEYAALLVAPTNLRMNPADPANHNTIPVAWDFSGLLPPDSFQVVLTDNVGNWLQSPTVAGSARSYTFSAAQNAQYQVYVKAIKAGRADTAWLGPLHWALGRDPQPFQVPVYGWGAEGEWVPASNHIQLVTSVANNDSNFGPSRAIDGDFNSRWNSGVVTATGGNQGEGMRITLPYWLHYLINGIRLWNWGSHTAWLGIFLNGGWQGGLSPYVGPTFLAHPYAAGAGPFQWVGDVRLGPYDILNHSEAAFDLLMQGPTSDGFDPRISIYELRVLYQEWVVTSYNTQFTAALPSGTW